MPHICMSVCVYIHTLYYNCVLSAERLAKINVGYLQKIRCTEGEGRVY